MKLDLRAKLLGTIGGLACLALTLTILQGMNARDAWAAWNRADRTRDAGTAILDAASRLAIERGRMYIALADDHPTETVRNKAETERVTAQAATVKALAITEAIGLATSTARQTVAKLDAARLIAVASLAHDAPRNTETWFDTETDAIDALLSLSEQIPATLSPTEGARMADSFALTGALAHIAELLAQERGIIAGVIAGGRPVTPAQLLMLGRAEGMLSRRAKSVTIRAGRLGQDYAEALVPAEAAITWFRQPVQELVGASVLSSPRRTDPSLWFDTATAAIDKVVGVQQIIDRLVYADFAHGGRAAARRLWFDLVGILVIVTLIFSAAYMVLVRFVQPLYALKDAIDCLARADYGRQVPYLARDDELGTIARSVAILQRNSIEAAQLRAEKDLQREAEERRQKIDMAAAAATNSRLDQLAQHLAQARDQAQLANEAKSRFLASISHELRTPLNGILGYAQLLWLDEDLEQPQRDQVAEMLSSGEHLLGMINAVLDLSQIESDRLELQPVVITMASFAQKCLSVVKPAAFAKSLALVSWSDPEAPIAIHADPTRLRQVIVNLLGNAVKFTQAGLVELRLLPGREDRHVRIEVVDTGPGIAVGDCEKLFREFSRLANEAVGKVEGAGLGLAITARLVQRMGGQIGYMRKQGGGSIFWVELPEGEIPAVCTAKSMEPGSDCLSKGLRILVVDDVKMNREIAMKFLQIGGHTVEEAASGEAAVAAVRSADYNVVLMDVQMPGLDGLEATRRIRALPAPRGAVQVVAMTAQAFADQIEQCMDAGMNAHVSKPLDYSALLTAVTEAHLRGKQAQMVDVANDTEVPLLDEAVYRVTRDILSSEDLQTYLESLINRGRALLARIPGGETHVNASELSLSVHELRGSASTFGFRKLDIVAADFERAAYLASPNLGELTLTLSKVLHESISLLEGLLIESGGPNLAVSCFK